MRNRGFEPGDPIVIRTPDRREFRGIALEMREVGDGRQVVLVRLDTGWETTYPMEMVHPDIGRGA